jgi:large-conductance mechanosensitive channel
MYYLGVLVTYDIFIKWKEDKKIRKKEEEDRKKKEEEKKNKNKILLRTGK